MRRILLLPLLALAAAPTSAPTLSSPPLLPTVAWDPATLRLIEPHADYGRLARLPDRSLACVYNTPAGMFIRRSTDDGLTYAPPVRVAADPDAWLTNAHLLPLHDGTLLYLWNERPKLAVAHQHDPPSAPSAHPSLTRPFLIRASRSTDLGQSWSPPVTLYTAGTTFNNGCWEPAALQLPSGEIQIYFANEAPFPTTDEQEISLLRSPDNAATWSPAQRISFRPHHRDGMPAPLLLPSQPGTRNKELGTKTIALAIEDNGLNGDRFKIAILTTTDNWQSSTRHPALANPLPPTTYAGAPHLVQLPTGPTLLSCQESEDGSPDPLAHCRMAVYVGDPAALHFTHKSYPLPAPTKGNQAWNALFVKNPTTITAILTATIDNVHGVYTIDGHVTEDN